MDLQSLSWITFLGAAMAIIGAVYWIVRLLRFQKAQRDLQSSNTSDPDVESNTFATFWMANGLLHLGMLLLVLGGAGLIYYGLR